jgi:hypothetical protein
MKLAWSEHEHEHEYGHGHEHEHEHGPESQSVWLKLLLQEPFKGFRQTPSDAHRG